MSKRLVPIYAALGAVAYAAIAGMSADDFNVVHVFLGLLVLLVLSGAVLWPRSGRDQRAELELERLGWADRIELPRGPTPPQRIGRPTAPGKMRHAPKSS